MTELKFVRLYKNTKRNRWAMAVEMTRDYGTRQRGVTAEIVQKTGEGDSTLANYYYAGLAALVLRAVDNPKFSTLRRTLPFNYFYKAGRALKAETDPEYVLHVLEESKGRGIEWIGGRLNVESDNRRSPARKARNHLLGLLSLVDSMGIPPDLAEEIRVLAKRLKGYVK